MSDPLAAGRNGVQSHPVVDLRQRPPRPGIPLVLIGALLLWGAAAAIFFALPFPDGASCIPFMAVSCAAAVTACIVGMLCPFARAAFAIAFMLLGCALGALAALSVFQGHAAADAGMQAARLFVLQDSSRSDHGFSTLCEAQGAEGTRVKVRLLTSEDESFLTGDALTCDAPIAPLKEEARAFFRTQGVCGQISGARVILEEQEGPLGMLRSVRAQAISLISAHAGDQAPLFAAIVCGHRLDMARSALYDDFKVCGLAHVVAVSGAHAAIVIMMLLWLLRALRAPRWCAVMLSILLVGAYVVFAGMPLSAIRSALMSSLALLSFFARRRAASLGSIGLCAIAFIASDPVACLSVSLFLSAGSTLGIVLFAGLFSSWPPRVPERVRRIVVEPVSLTLSSNVVTLPFSAALFSQLPLIAPAANVLAAPALALACTVGLGSCILALVMPPAAELLIGASSLSMLPLTLIVRLLAAVPFACVACSLDPVAMIAASAAASVLLWSAWPRPSKRAACVGAGLVAGACAIVVAIMLLPKGHEVTALDVGQGDAILIRSGTASVLVDTGNSDAKLREALGWAGVHHLDAVIVTHPDDDHCASLASLGGYVQMDRICFAKDVLTCSCEKCARLLALAGECAPFAEMRGLSVGDELSAGGFTLKVIWPDRFTDEGGNADSVCLLGELDCDGDGIVDWRALFTGDAESEELDQMMGSGRVGDIDLLKVGHHGSKASLTDEDVASIRPEAALISCGANNRYGHPSQEALDRLASVGCAVSRTDESGSITVTFTKDSMRVGA